MTPHEIKEFIKQTEEMCNMTTKGVWKATDIPYNNFNDPCIICENGEEESIYIAQTVYDMQSGTQTHNINGDTLFIANAHSALPKALDIIKELLSKIQ